MLKVTFSGRGFRGESNNEGMPCLKPTKTRATVGLGEWNGCCLCLCDVFFLYFVSEFPLFDCLLFDCLLVWLFV